ALPRWTSTSARPTPSPVPAGSAAPAGSTCGGRWSATATSTCVRWPARSATPTSPAMPRSSSRAGRTASWAASAGSPTPRTCSPDLLSPHVKETLMTKFRVGVIGAGSIAQSHLAAYSANEGVELIAEIGIRDSDCPGYAAIEFEGWEDCLLGCERGIANAENLFA